MRIIFASSNKNKIFEIKNIFSDYGVEVDALPSGKKNVPPEENGRSFRENADIKAIYYSLQAKVPVLADDSGLCVEVLEGAPGIYSSRFAGSGATDSENIKKLLEKMKQCRLPSERKARFECHVSLAQNGKIIKRARGIVSGYILKEQTGPNGFGYDPVFYYRPYKKSFAELSNEEKNRVSHRFRACRKMAQYLCGRGRRLTVNKNKGSLCAE